MMAKTHFLTTVQDQDLREKLWGLFCKAEMKAKWFPISRNDWVEITSFIESSDTRWRDGQIEINPKWDDLGQIFHEVFHSAFHYSPLWRDSVNNSWGDGFCDAFRYFMEEKYLSDSKWYANIGKYLTMSIDEIIEKPTNMGWKLEYCIPATRIINKANKNYEDFKKLWQELNRRPNNPLEEYFDFPKRELRKKFNL